MNIHSIIVSTEFVNNIFDYELVPYNYNQCTLYPYATSNIKLQYLFMSYILGFGVNKQMSFPNKEVTVDVMKTIRQRYFIKI